MSQPTTDQSLLLIDVEEMRVRVLAAPGLELSEEEKQAALQGALLRLLRFNETSHCLVMRGSEASPESAAASLGLKVAKADRPPNAIAFVANAARQRGFIVTVASSSPSVAHLSEIGVDLLDPVTLTWIDPEAQKATFGTHGARVAPMLSLRMAAGVGPAIATRLLDRFGDVEAVLAATDGLAPGLRTSLAAARSSIQQRLSELTAEARPCPALSPRDLLLGEDALALIRAPSRTTLVRVAPRSSDAVEHLPKRS